MQRQGRRIGAGMQKLYIPVRDNYKLAVLYWPNPATRTLVIFSHHFGGTKEALIKHARLIYGMGYSVLLFDYSNHGENEPIRKWNIFDQFINDLQETIQFIQKSESSINKVVLFAFSLTTFVALYAASGIPMIDTVICDSGPAHSHYEVFKRFCDRVWSKKRMPGGRLLFILWCRILFGGPDPRNIACSLKKKRILIMQGDKDNIIPKHSVLEFCKSVNNCEIHFESFSQGTHLTALSIDTERYVRVLKTFLDGN